MNTQQLITAFEEFFEITLPTRWEVCPQCQGRAQIPLPGIAITEEDFAEDPDFREDYFSGRLDQPCPTCNGRSTVKLVDEERLAPAVKNDWQAWLREEANTRQIEAMERRMGA